MTPWTCEEITAGRLFRLYGPDGQEIVMQLRDDGAAAKVVAALNLLEAVATTTPMVKTAEGKK
jgi:hypothetical protein